MIEAEEGSMEDNSHMLEKLTNHNPPTYDGAPNPKAFEDWIRGI